MTFLERVKQRKIGQWGLAYIAGAWVVAQVVDVVAEPFGLPLGTHRGVLIALAFGFPLVLILAWYHGERGRQRVSGTELLAVTGLLLVLGIVLARWAPARGESSTRRATGVPDGLPSVAVLPFEDRGTSDDDGAFFAAGMHDDLLTQLSKLAGLRVISRTSVMQYADSEVPIRAIGEELGVDAVLEGGVQRAGNRVRLNLQLIDARSDDHMWAETYDRELTVANVLGIQSEIARLVADALEATLTPEEEDRLTRPTTDQLAAYDLYLRGHQVLGTRTVPANDEAIRLFREATALDSGYAVAWGGLALAYAYKNIRFGFSPAYLDSTMTAADRALAFDRETSTAYQARSLVYIGHGQLGRSLDESLTAVRYDPNDAGAVNIVGVNYHSVGQFDEALRWIRRAAALEPTALFYRTNIAGLYTHLGETELADSVLREVGRLDPDYPISEAQYMSLARARGDLDGLLAAAKRWVELTPDDPAAHYGLAAASLDTRDWQAARDYMDRAYELSPDGEFREEDQHLGTTVLGFALLQLGEAERGRELLVRSVRSMADELADGGDFPLLHWELGAAHAAMGNVTGALDALEDAVTTGWRDDRWPHMDPVMDLVRDDARFESLMAFMEEDIAAQRLRVAQDERTAGLR